MKLDGTRVCVAGLGVTGPSAVRALLAQGAHVVAVDGRDGDRERALADELRAAGAEVRLGDGDTLPDGVALVVTSPGWRPDAPLLAAAAAREVPVWGDVELAYRLRPAGQEWLGVTGTNGKTTTVQMLASILRAAGHRAVATGNVGFPVLDAVLADPPYDVLAVEVSSFQLHWTSTVEFISGAVLNIAPDHLDWHGSLEAYAADKALVWRSDWYAVYNADDPIVSALVAPIADTQSFSLRATPRAGFALVGDQLVDRGIGTDPGEQVERVPDGGVVLAERADIPVPGLHNVANALAAAALARSLHSATGGRLAVHPADVRAGLRAFDPGAHRIAHVATVDGVEYVDDSKATNAHAAAASLSAYPSVVWVAGGLAKGATFDELVTGGGGPAPRRRADRPRPGADRGGTRATRARDPGRRGHRHGHWSDAGRCRDGRRRARRRGARAPRRHRAARARLRVDGHVPRLRRARRRLRGRRARGCPADRPSDHDHLRPGPARAGRPDGGRRRAAVSLLQRPATPYYLLLGASTLLLVLGLVMVFSASSVVAFAFMDSSMAIVSKQAMWVVIGLPLTWCASRLPPKLWRIVAYPALVTSLALLVLVVVAGTEVNGNKNWLDFGGPFRIQPSELAKLSLVLWGADLLARKERLLGQWKHLLVPMLPVGGLDPGRWSCSAATSARRSSSRPCSARCCGSPAHRLRLYAHGLGAGRCWSSPGWSTPGRPGCRGSRCGCTRTRPTRSATGCRRCTASSRWPRAAGGAWAWAGPRRSGAPCPRRTPTSSSRSSARSSGWSAPSRCSACSA